jgi:lia operon protein LiaG
MKRTTVVLAGLAWAASLSPLAAQSPERFTLAGTRTAVYNMVGSISVGPGTGSSVTVEVTRQGADASQLRVESGPINNRETLRIIFPDEDIIYGNRDWNGEAQIYVRDDGTFGGGYGDRDRDRGRRVYVKSRGDGTRAYADLRILVPPGKDVGVFIGIGEINASNVNGEIRLDASSGNITAERMRGILFVDTGSGNVEVSNVEGTELNIDTGSGDVRVTGASSADVTIDTGSGNVTGTTITATDLSVDTGSGNIELSGIKATSLNMDTGSGDVEVDLLTDTDDIKVDTGSGNVTIGVPSGFGSAVDLSTSSGDVDTDVEIQVTRRGRQHLVGRIGDGQGRMTIETGSGNVTIKASR